MRSECAVAFPQQHADQARVTATGYDKVQRTVAIQIPGNDGVWRRAGGVVHMGGKRAVPFAEQYPHRASLVVHDGEVGATVGIEIRNDDGPRWFRRRIVDRGGEPAIACAEQNAHRGGTEIRKHQVWLVVPVQVCCCHIHGVPSRKYRRASKGQHARAEYRGQARGTTGGQCNRGGRVTACHRHATGRTGGSAGGKTTRVGRHVGGAARRRPACDRYGALRPSRAARASGLV